MSEMSIGSPSPLSEEHDGALTDSVYDFLYHDARKVASYLAQFSTYGSLTGISHTEAAQRSRDRRSGLSAEGGLAGVAKASGTTSVEAASQIQESAQRAYDPLWVNALTFLDYLQERGLLVRELPSARIGQIVLFSGDLSVFDLGLLRQMWQLPTVKRAVIEGAGETAPNASELQGTGNRQERRRNNNQRARPAAQSEAEIALEIMPVLPHMVQMSVSTVDNSVWGTLREDSLVASPSELMMKHGMSIDGTWHVVGVLDAFPDEDFQPEQGPSLAMLRQMMAGAQLGHLAFSMASSLMPMIRQILGRPSSSYGVTPLLVFREISS